ncbi:hypothetical protein IGI04_028380, partial [Brassica rapa subsp. trilocularis]
KGSKPTKPTTDRNPKHSSPPPILHHRSSVFDIFVERYKGKDISVVAESVASILMVVVIEMDTSVEGRGFIFGPPIAMAIGAKFVPMRKPKKLPARTDCSMARTQKNKATAHHLDLLKCGMSPLLQNQLAELTNQKQQQQVATGGDKKRRKLVVVSQNCIEPLQALCDGSKEVMSMKGQSADKRRDIATLRKKRKEEKIVFVPIEMTFLVNRGLARCAREVHV